MKLFAVCVLYRCCAAAGSISQIIRCYTLLPSAKPTLEAGSSRLVRPWRADRCFLSYGKARSCTRRFVIIENPARFRFYPGMLSRRIGDFQYLLTWKNSYLIQFNYIADEVPGRVILVTSSRLAQACRADRCCLRYDKARSLCMKRTKHVFVYSRGAIVSFRIF